MKFLKGGKVINSFLPLVPHYSPPVPCCPKDEYPWAFLLQDSPMHFMHLFFFFLLLFFVFVLPFKMEPKHQPHQTPLECARTELTNQVRSSDIGV